METDRDGRLEVTIFFGSRAHGMTKARYKFPEQLENAIAALRLGAGGDDPDGSLLDLAQANSTRRRGALRLAIGMARRMAEAAESEGEDGQ